MELQVAVESAVLSLGASPWILVAVALAAAVDGVFPPVPSESLVIAVAVLSATGDGPSLWVLVPAAALGAFVGDVLAFTIGTRVPADRLRRLCGRRGRTALDHVRDGLTRRGPVLILSARFVPIGRVAVNMTAGAVSYPRRRFLPVAAVAANVWALGSVLMGLGAGQLLGERPLVAVVVGVGCGLVVGLAVEGLRLALARRSARRAPQY